MTFCALDSSAIKPLQGSLLNIQSQHFMESKKYFVSWRNLAMKNTHELPSMIYWLVEVGSFCVLNNDQIKFKQPRCFVHSGVIKLPNVGVGLSNTHLR